jgi:hypothetical protein
VRRAYLFLAVAVILSFGLIVFARARAIAAPAWEYRVIGLTDIVDVQEAMREPAKANASAEIKFNELGREGWELFGQLNGTVVFKRVKP